MVTSYSTGVSANVNAVCKFIRADERPVSHVRFCALPPCQTKHWSWRNQSCFLAPIVWYLVRCSLSAIDSVLRAVLHVNKCARVALQLARRLRAGGIPWIWEHHRWAPEYRFFLWPCSMHNKTSHDTGMWTTRSMNDTSAGYRHAQFGHKTFVAWSGLVERVSECEEWNQTQTQMDPDLRPPRRSFHMSPFALPCTEVCDGVGFAGSLSCLFPARWRCRANVAVLQCTAERLFLMFTSLCSLLVLDSPQVGDQTSPTNPRERSS